MKRDMIDTIPLRLEYEPPADPEHALSESDQKALAVIRDLFLDLREWKNARRYQCESAVAAVKIESAFNYHDESWGEFSVMRIERITQAEFEEMKKTANQADFSHPFKFLEGKAESCFVWRSESYLLGKIQYYHDVEKVHWDWLTIAYISGIPNVPGFFRLIAAFGDDRAFCN